MKTLLVGKLTDHPGRYFYRCPLDDKHSKSLIWCDEYHRKDPAGKIPDFVANQSGRENEYPRRVGQMKANALQSIRLVRLLLGMKRR